MELYDKLFSCMELCAKPFWYMKINGIEDKSYISHTLLNRNFITSVFILAIFVKCMSISMHGNR